MTAAVKRNAAPDVTEDGTAAEDEQPTYAFQPAEGDPIVIPKASVLWGDVGGKGATEFLWEIRKLNETYQSFEFMDRAQVPDEVQRRIVRLPFEERRELFRGWFAELREPPSKGELPPES